MLQIKIQKVTIELKNSKLRMIESVNISLYTRQRKIGAGSFAEVYKIMEKNTGKIFAAKILTQKLKELNKEEYKNLKREISIMSQLKHPAIIKFYGYSPFDFKRKRHPTIIMEYLASQTLKDVLDLERKSNAPPSWDDTKKLINIYWIASAMSYLHENNIIHRDLKPENILMDESYFPRIADFGLSKSVNTDRTVLYKGTPKYSPLEVLDGSNYSFASDVYAYGLIVYEIMTNQIPFESVDKNGLLGKLVGNQMPYIDQTVPDSYKDLITQCWSKNPQERPSFKKVLYMLENDEGFITSTVDRDEFLNYVDYVNTWTDSTAINVNNDDDDDCSPEKVEEKKPEEEEDDFEELDDDFIQKNYRTKEEITKIYKESADKGNLYSIVKYGEMLFNGEGVQENKEVAVDYFKMASDYGSLEGMTNYGIALISGEGVSEDKERAVKLFKKASYKGNLRATVRYADSLFNGNGIERNTKKAIEMYKRAAAKGELEAIVKYADILYNGNEVAADKEKATQLYKRAADKGHIGSMFVYANIMYNKNDCPESKAEAARYFKIAADLGHLKSILNIAYMYCRGEGVKIDKSESLRYYKMASDQGNTDGMNNYATLLMQKEEEEKKDQNEETERYNQSTSDYQNISETELSLSLIENEEDMNLKEAARLFKLASDMGNLDAMNNYANLLYLGKIVPEDKQQAANLYKSAADGGHADAMNNYANILMKGDEVTQKNEQLAVQYYQKAADKDHKYGSYNYALFLEKSGADRDMIKKYFKISADKHNKYAEYHYARYLMNENSLSEAMKYFKMAADDGHTESAYIYGKNKYFGENEVADKSDGLAYIQKGIEKHHDRSNLIGHMIEYGRSCNIA